MDRNLVIDGQQRLSTIQYVLKALALLCAEHQYEDGHHSIQTELRNDGALMDKPSQIHKLWPTFRDRDAHQKIMAAANCTELQAAFPDSFKRNGELYVNGTHPRPLECVWYFRQAFKLWNDELVKEGRAHDGLEAIRLAVTRSLQLIVLWLEPSDDPQTIFSTLNGRGAPLRPTDLIKNHIFAQAEQESSGKELGEDSPIFITWSSLEEPEWMEISTRGGKRQSRLEWLIFYALQAETGNDVDTTRIYDAYQRWGAQRTTKTIPAEQQVDILVAHARNFKLFEGAEPTSAIGRFGKAAQALDLTVVTPLALAIAASCTDDVQSEMFSVLASYLIRREACGLSKKAYNVTFPAILRELRKRGFTCEVLKSYLLTALSGDTSVWPDDQRFMAAVVNRPIYGSGAALQVCRILLAAAASKIGGARSSELQWQLDWSVLHVEHAMPQSWYAHWPLQDGIFVDESDALLASLGLDGDTDDARRNREITKRESLKNTLGNLTVLHAVINIEISNREWSVKREAIRAATQLRMNYDLVDREVWDTSSIEERGREMGMMLTEIWPHPGSIKQP